MALSMLARWNRESLPPRYAWGLLLGSAALGATLFATALGAPPAVGTTVRRMTTVVPNDAVELACSSAEPMAGHRCDHDGPRPAAPSEIPHLKPYLTVDKELVLWSGLFEEPNVAAWLRKARVAHPNDRVTLRCDVTTLGTFKVVEVRFHTTDAFTTEHDVVAAHVDGCEVRE